MTTSRPLRVFLCHSSNDKPAVRELYQKLRAEPWIQPWLDEEELYPGQDWNMEIEKAIEATDAILVCLSKNSITKEGYVQREIRIALDYADYKPEGALFIIPVRLEECTPPKRLARWQYADYFEGQHERSLQRLLTGLKRQSVKLSEKKELELSSFEETLPKIEGAKSTNFNQNKSVVKVSRSTLNGHPSREWIEENKIALSNGMDFLRVPAGEFLMGNGDLESYSDELKYRNGNSRHIVDIPYDYWIGRHLVTNEQYNDFINYINTKHPVRDWEQFKSYPVGVVQWSMALEFCQWLNDLMKNEIPSDLSLRLPTEAEWEKAACWKPSSKGGNALIYPWGNEFDSTKCNSVESKKNTITPVGLYSPRGDSPYGCTDMAGNVFEWTNSLRKDYPYDPRDGREDIYATGSRVTRGGSFMNTSLVLCCSLRRVLGEPMPGGYTGFRVCLAPQLPN